MFMDSYSYRFNRCLGIHLGDTFPPDDFLPVTMRYTTSFMMEVNNDMGSSALVMTDWYRRALQDAENVSNFVNPFTRMCCIILENIW